MLTINNFCFSLTFSWNDLYHHVIVIEYVYSICTINTGGRFLYFYQKQCIVIKLMIIVPS